MGNPTEIARVGDTVRCIDASSKPDWAAWYMDNGYAEDMLVRGKSYLVRDVAERDGEIGYDIGITTPWGDPYWAAGRFEKALLRLPVSAVREALLASPTPEDHSHG